MANHFELKPYQVFLSDGESAYYVVAYGSGHAVVEVCNELNKAEGGLEEDEFGMIPDEFETASVKELSLEEAYEHVIDFVYLDPKDLEGLDVEKQISFGELFEYLEVLVDPIRPLYGVVGDNFVSYN